MYDVPSFYFSSGSEIIDYNYYIIFYAMDYRYIILLNTIYFVVKFYHS